MIIGIPRNRKHSYSYWRVINPLSTLKHMWGYQSTFFNPLDRAEYMNLDWVLLHMPFNMAAERVIKTCQEMGVQIWIDVDDNPFTVPFSNKQWAECYTDSNRIAWIMSQANLITFGSLPNREICTAHEMIDRSKTRLLHNNLNPIDFPARKQTREDGKVIGVWRGSDSHIEDHMEFPTMFYDWSQELDELHIMGARLPINTNLLQCEWKYHKEKSLWDYMETLYRIQPDYMFTYWADIPFNATKTNVLWQEATAVGAVCCVNSGWYAFKEFSVHEYDKDAITLLSKEERMSIWRQSKAEMVEWNANCLKELREVVNVFLH